MPLSPGQRLGAYEILDQLGAGGMGEVCRARDARLQRTVAITQFAVSSDGMRILIRRSVGSSSSRRST